MYTLKVLYYYYYSYYYYYYYNVYLWGHKHYMEIQTVWDLVPLFSYNPARGHHMDFC